jgi:hypothetical protein
MSDNPLHAAFPSGPLLDPATGLVSGAWRGFFMALYNRTGAATGASVGVTQASLDAETAARIEGDNRLQAQISGLPPGPAPATVTMQSGGSTSDSAGLINVMLPVAYTTRTLSFQVNGGTAEPHAYYDPGAPPTPAITTTQVTGTLMKDVGGTPVAVGDAKFVWYATGV